MCVERHGEEMESAGRCHRHGGRVRSFIQPRLLLLLAEKPAHGYELMERLGQEEDPGPIRGCCTGLCASSRKRGWYGRRGTRRVGARRGGCTRSPTKD